MALDCTIDRAEPAEAAALLALMRRAFAEYRGVLRPESSVFVETADFIAGQLAQGGGFVARGGVGLVGCIIAEEKGEAESRRGYLGRLAVDPAWRRRGIAAALIDAAEAHLRARGLARAELNVRIALAGNIALFQALGYRETGRGTHAGFAAPTYLIMEKALACTGAEAEP